LELSAPPAGKGTSDRLQYRRRRIVLGERYLVDQRGKVVRAYLAVRENSGEYGHYGPSSEYQSLIFESTCGDWLGSIVVSTPEPIQDFSDDDLRLLLKLVRYLNLRE
jgi:hypothetical protein